MKKNALLLAAIALLPITAGAQEASTADEAEEIVVAQPQPMQQDSAPLSYTLVIKSDQAYTVSVKPEQQTKQKAQAAFPRHYLTFSVGDAFFAHEMNMGIIVNYDPFPPSYRDWFEDDIYTSRTVRLPNFELSYYYAFRKWFLLGAEVGYNYLGYEQRYVTDNSHYRTNSEHMLTMMLSARFEYINNKYFGLYQGLAFGVGLIFGTKDTELQYVSPLPAFQFNLLGMRFGNKVYGTLELGIGAKGFANIGIGTRF